MYVKVTNGSVDTYPYNVGQLRRDNPNTSFPRTIPDEVLAEYGVYPVSVSDAPSYDIKTQNLVQDANPSLSDGVWTIGYTVESKSAAEVTAYSDARASYNRNVRDDLIAKTDFYALSDVTMDAAMTTYRQALRDITSHANWPHLNDDDWPTKP